MDPNKAIEEFNHPDTSPRERADIALGLADWLSMGAFAPIGTLCDYAIETVRSVDREACLAAEQWNLDATPGGQY